MLDRVQQIIYNLFSLHKYIQRNHSILLLLTSFAKLIEFYKTDMTNDAPDVTEFMKNSTPEEILANRELWGEDLTRLLPEVLEYVNK